MEKHYQLTDDEFVKSFADCSLEPSWFSHEGHLRLAWVSIDQHGLDKAVEMVCEQILRFDQVHDKGEKFNKTVTVACVKAVNHFMNRSSTRDFRTLLEEFPKLKSDLKGLIETHYGIDIFNSPKAKKQFIEPDLVPF